MLLVTPEVNVSVVVPVYNSEAFLLECVESILAQTLPKIELILVDDGSTDRSGIFCDACQKKFASISVLHEKNQGAAAARLAGARAAKGDYVGFVDSDDVISPYMYETLFSAASRFDLDCARIETQDMALPARPARAAPAGEFTVYTGAGLRKRYGEIYFSGNETVSMCDKIVRRSILLSGNGEEEVRNVLEDFYINMNMALKFSRCGELHRAYYFARYRPGSLSRRYTDQDFPTLLKVQERKDEIIGQMGGTPGERLLARKWFIDYTVSLVSKIIEFQKGKAGRQKALELLENLRVVENAGKLSDVSEPWSRLLHKMIGHKKSRLAFAMILLHYKVRRIYGFFRYRRPFLSKSGERGRQKNLSSAAQKIPGKPLSRT